MTSPPATTDSSDNNTNAAGNGNINGNNSLNLMKMSSMYLAADDLLVFLDGSGDGNGDECDHCPTSLTAATEVGIPSGWLSAVWSEFGR